MQGDDAMIRKLLVLVTIVGLSLAAVVWRPPAVSAALSWQTSAPR